MPGVGPPLAAKSQQQQKVDVKRFLIEEYSSERAISIPKFCQL